MKSRVFESEGVFNRTKKRILLDLETVFEKKNSETIEGEK